MAVHERVAGRPRDSEAGPALLEAARKLVLEHGYDAVSIGSIAAEAGVGRQTLYRRWQSKAELVLEAFLESASRIDVDTHTSTVAALTGFLEALFRNLAIDGPAIRRLIASAQSDPQFLAIFKDNFVKPRAEIVRKILTRGIERGELSDLADIDLAVVTLHGAFWYLLLQGETLDEELAKRLANYTLQRCGSK